MKKNHTFSISIFIIGILLVVIMDNIIPLGPRTYIDLVLECIILGLTISGMFLVIRSYIIELILKAKSKK